MVGKNVLIIGASGDIGSAIALKLVEEGYQLLLHYNHNLTRINEIMDKVDKETILATYQADLSLDKDVTKLLMNVAYPVDCIVFASGIAHYGLFQDTTEKEMEKMLSIHVKAPWLIVQHFLPEMIRRKTGKIMLITSIWGEVGASNEVLYSTVKGAQNSFVKALAKEVGPSGILVNAISPGFIATKMNSQLSVEETNTIIDEIPLTRAGTPKDVAEVACFLLSDASSYIHGEIIRLNGGW
ncbi:SDR family oxidoreductase [Virgibacillus sp. LDC-1]|uniref:elongation factor P 5-aminopentanone reductase n=1 Tax=Virgibacillus sp. LDC-1 TaxID=3039856 RepID=UPI0032E7F51D